MTDAVEKTIEAYEERAEEYAQARPGLEHLKEPLEFFIKNLKGKKILDVGCCAGRDDKYFIEQGLEVTGIDPVPKFIELAKGNVPRAKFLLMDMRQLEFQENSFDGIWVNASLLHIPKKEAKQTITGFKKALKPGGILFIHVKQGEGEGMVFEDGMNRFFAYYAKDELENLIKNTGMKVIQTINTFRKEVTWIGTFATKPL